MKVESKSQLEQVLIGKLKDYNSLDTIRLLINREYKNGNKNIFCYYCLHEFSKSYEGYNLMTVDHKISQSEVDNCLNDNPKFFGDIDMISDPVNLVIACRVCNSSKGKSKLFNYRNGQVIETEAFLEFRNRMTYAKKGYDSWAELCVFSAFSSDVSTDWFTENKYRGLVKNEIEKFDPNGDMFSDIVDVKDGFNFTYRGYKKIFSFWTVNMGVYIRSSSFFREHIEFFKNNEYSIITGSKFIGIYPPNIMILKIIEELNKIMGQINK